MRIIPILLWLVGAGFLAWLVAANDFGALVGSLSRLDGWFVVICAYHALPLSCDVLGWREVFLRPPRLPGLMRARWISEAASGLLPVPLLGELLRVKLPYDAGAELADAASAATAGITTALATQVMFVTVGLILFSLHGGSGTLLRSFATLVVLAGFGGAFYWAQRRHFLSRSLDWAARRIGGPLKHFDRTALRRIEDTLHVVYERRRKLAGALAWHFAGWFAGAGEIWLVAWFTGTPIGLGDAIVFESLSQGARAAAFVIPGGLGVQDGTLMVLTAGLGFGPELGLLISLVKRLRELSLGVPALALAYRTELRRAGQPGSIRDAKRAIDGMIRGRKSRGS